jgi:hypothetical protein
MVPFVAQSPVPQRAALGVKLPFQVGEPQVKHLGFQTPAPTS